MQVVGFPMRRLICLNKNIIFHRNILSFSAHTKTFLRSTHYRESNNVNVILADGVTVSDTDNLQTWSMLGKQIETSDAVLSFILGTSFAKHDVLKYNATCKIHVQVEMGITEIIKIQLSPTRCDFHTRPETHISAQWVTDLLTMKTPYHACGHSRYKQ